MAGSAPSSPLHLGRVITFDARRGWGTVLDRLGTEFDFHATAVADGSRAIAPGTEVHFLVAAGHRGRDEARALTAVELLQTT